MTGTVIAGFGSSDCSCEGHLFYYPSDPHDDILQILQSFAEKDTDVLQIEVRTP